MHILSCMDKEKLFREALNNSGVRISAQRLIIFRALLRSSPVSGLKLVEMASKNGIDRTTTYRTLALFRKHGIVRDVVAGGKRLVELSDDYLAHHHHFWCRKCGKLTDFDSRVVESSLSETVRAIGGTMMSHHVEISGICVDCSVKTDG